MLFEVVLWLGASVSRSGFKARFFSLYSVCLCAHRRVTPGANDGWLFAKFYISVFSLSSHLRSREATNLSIEIADLPTSERFNIAQRRDIKKEEGKK